MVHARQLYAAVEDEISKERRRQEVLKACIMKASYTRVREQQDKERRLAREYIRRLQHDNEVVLVKEMVESGLLW